MVGWLQSTNIRTTGCDRAMLYLGIPEAEKGKPTRETVTGDPVYSLVPHQHDPTAHIQSVVF